MDTTIAKAKTKDFESILLLEKAWKQEGITPNMQLSPKSEIKIAIKEGRILIAKNKNIEGFLQYKFYDKTTCELSSIYIVKRARHNGIGKELMKVFLNLSRIKKCRKIYVHVDSLEEERLLSFYRAFKFEKIAVLMVRKHKQKY
ncbi:MAG: GNAT family N-acetyltransferase [Candidatus Micrarchaeia archaeon]